MATKQNQPRSFEARRAERRRRERRRKKRIRAVLLLILLIALIVLVIIAFASCSGRRAETGEASEGMTEIQTPAPTDALSVPTEAPTSGIASLPSPDEENNLLNIITDMDSRGAEKTAYLTFDDGPSENVTPSILDTLRRYNVKATFFMLGTSIDSYPDLARRVYEEGHLIANHSHGHNYETLYATEESFMTEVQETEASIERITNNDHKFKLFRFPGGSYNAGDHASEKQIYKRTLAVNGFYYVDWNALNGDAEGRTKNAPQLLEYLKMNLDTDSCAVILMHDAAAKTATAEGLGSIIEYLMSEGYVFKRLDEMPYVAPEADAPSSDGGTYSGYDDTRGYGDSDSDADYDADYNTDYDEDSDSSGGSDSSDSDGTSGSSAGGANTSGGGSILSTPSAGSTTRTSVSGISVTEPEGSGDDE